MFVIRLVPLPSNRWRELLAGKERLGFPSWSRNGRSIFVSEGTSRIRLGITDGRPEVVARFEGVRRPWNTRDWVGSAPDDSLITLRDLSVQEIFALDWEAPRLWPGPRLSAAIASAPCAWPTSSWCSTARA